MVNWLLGPTDMIIVAVKPIMQTYVILGLTRIWAAVVKVYITTYMLYGVTYTPSC